MRDEDYTGPWCAAHCRCDICGYAYVAVFPAELNEGVDRLQCPQCGEMAVEPVEYIPSTSVPDATGPPKNVEEFLAMFKRTS